MIGDKKTTEIKRKAENYFVKGNFKKALEKYSELRELLPTDMRIVQKMGDIYQKLGDAEEAKITYKFAAEHYTKEGYWAKAVALNKIIIALDPDDREVQKQISDIYTSQGLSYQKIVLKEKQTDEASPSKSPESQNEAAETSPKEGKWRIPLFSELGPKAMSSLIDKLAVRRIRKGDIICQDGDEGRSMFVISEGWVEIYKESDGEKLFLDSLKEGDFFGEFGLLTDGKRHANAVAKSDTVLLEITSKHFEELSNAYPSVPEILDDYFKLRTFDNVLKKSSLFDSLYTEERLKILKAFETENFSKGSFVCKEGDPGNKLYFIKNGNIEISIHRDGDHIVIARLTTGDFFGEISLLTGKPRTANVRASTDLELLYMNKESFDSVMREHPQIAAKLKIKMEERAKDTIEAYQSHSEMKKCIGMV